METERLGSRCVLFSFKELACNLLAIYGDRRTYLCDTYLGPEPMAEVKKVFEADGRTGRPVVVFNSHFHWDHVWGNCAFPDSTILAHALCRTILEDRFDKELKDFGDCARGKITPRFPDLLFTTRVVFPDDGVEFYHTPGHTPDSATCRDLRDNILFVGDNVEEPIPYVFDANLEPFIASLEGYLAARPAEYVAGHGRDFPTNLIKANLDYLRRLAVGQEVDTSGWSEPLKKQHQANLKVLRAKAGGEVGGEPAPGEGSGGR